MSFNVVPKLSFTSALSVSVSLYFNKPLLRNGTLTVSSLTASENVHFLPLPKVLKKEILPFIEPVGEQIQAWLKEFQSAVAGHVNLHRKLCWTSLGIVDYGRTAGNCVSSGEWEDIDAFKLACGGSDPESIQRLWPIVKNSVLEEVEQSGLVVEDYSKRLQLWFKLWVSYLSGQIKKFRRVNDCNDYTDDEYFLFELAVKNNNVGATRFFLGEMKNRCGLNQLMLSLAREYVMGHRKKFKRSVFIFLASHFNEEEINELLHYHYTRGLIHLLPWPLLPFLVPMSEFVWSEMSYRNIDGLLERNLITIIDTQVPVAYESTFNALWIKTPQNYQYIFVRNHIYPVIRDLFEGYTPEGAIRVLFKGANAYQKFLDTFIPNAIAVMTIAVEDNSFKSFKNILQQYFAEDLVEDFEKEYAKCTYAYVNNEYYGNGILSSSSSDTELVFTYCKQPETDLCQSTCSAAPKMRNRYII